MAKPVPMSSDNECGHILSLTPVAYFPRCWFEMIFGQKSLKIHIRDYVWKVDSVFRSLSIILEHSNTYTRIAWMQLLYSFSFVLVVYWLDFQTVCRLLNAFLALDSLCLISVSAPTYVVALLPKYVRVSNMRECYLTFWPVVGY